MQNLHINKPKLLKVLPIAIPVSQVVWYEIAILHWSQCTNTATETATYLTSNFTTIPTFSSTGEDGPSQMALEDLAMFRAVQGSTVFYPSDAVSMERAVELAANTKGICFIRSSRPATPVVHGNNDVFEVGKAKVRTRCPYLFCSNWFQVCKKMNIFPTSYLKVVTVSMFCVISQGALNKFVLSWTLHVSLSLVYLKEWALNSIFNSVLDT